MGIVSGLIDSRRLNASTPYKPWDDFWYQNVAGIGTAVGISVTPLVALQVAAVFACVKVISEDIAALPLLLYRRRADGNGKDRAPEVPLYSLLHDSPNAWQTAFEFWEDQAGHVALHGTCYAEILPGEDGSAVGELVPLRPETVKVEQLTNRRLRYQVTVPGGSPRTLTQDQMFHVRGRSLDFVNALSLNTQARDAIALARAIDIYAARFFANDASIGSTLNHPGKLSKEAQERLESSFAAKFSGVWNSHKPKVLEEGMTFQRIPITNARDSRLTEAQEAAVIPICQFFRMQPHKVAHLLHATFSNIEHQEIAHVTDTLQPWCRRIEQRINTTLITDESLYAEFLLTGRLRGDSAARAAYMQSRFNLASMSPNDIRRLDGENPIDEAWADDYYLQGAMVPASRAGEHLDQKTEAQQQPKQLPPDPEQPKALLPAPTPPVPVPGMSGAALQPLIQDASQRIARAEIRELEPRIEKHGADADRFSAWLAGFYTQHTAYVQRTMAPIVDVARVTRLSDTELATVVAAVLAGRFVTGTDFSAWREQREPAVGAAITGSLAMRENPKAAEPVAAIPAPPPLSLTVNIEQPPQSKGPVTKVIQYDRAPSGAIVGTRVTEKGVAKHVAFERDERGAIIGTITTEEPAA